MILNTESDYSAMVVGGSATPLKASISHPTAGFRAVRREPVRACRRTPRIGCPNRARPRRSRAFPRHHRHHPGIAGRIFSTTARITSYLPGISS